MEGAQRLCSSAGPAGLRPLGRQRMRTRRPSFALSALDVDGGLQAVDAAGLRARACARVDAARGAGLRGPKRWAAGDGRLAGQGAGHGLVVLVGCARRASGSARASSRCRVSPWHSRQRDRDHCGVDCARHRRILAVVRASLAESALAKLKRESRGLYRPKRLTGGVVRDRVSGAQADALQGRSRPPRPLLRSRPSLSRRHRPRLRRGRQSRSPPLRWRPAP